MAASAAYIDIAKINLSSGVYDESKSFANISATTAAFKLRGGEYGVTVHATFAAGSVTLQKLAGDGSTWLTALTAFSADGYGTAFLPEGDYRVALA